MESLEASFKFCVHTFCAKKFAIGGVVFFKAIGAVNRTGKSTWKWKGGAGGSKIYEVLQGGGVVVKIFEFLIYAECERFLKQDYQIHPCPNTENCVVNSVNA